MFLTAWRGCFGIFRNSSCRHQRGSTLAMFGRNFKPCLNSWTPSGLTLRELRVRWACVFSTITCLTHQRDQRHRKEQEIWWEKILEEAGRKGSRGGMKLTLVKTPLSISLEVWKLRRAGKFSFQASLETERRMPREVAL